MVAMAAPESSIKKRSQHMSDAGDNQLGLGQIFKDPRFLSVLGLVGLSTPEQL